MILFINTSQADITQVKLIDNGGIVGSVESNERFKQSEMLLGMIDGILKKGRSKKEEVRSIAVIKGPGGFSSLRLGISTANALAWSLQVPLIGLSAEEASNDQILVESLVKHQENLQSKDFIPIKPEYGREPNITVNF